MADLGEALKNAITTRRGGRSFGMAGAPQIDPSLAPLVANIFAQYPALAQHRQDFAVVRGRPMIRGDDRQLESYAPDESWSPLPGKATTELYNSAVPPAEQQQLIAGDLLHHLPDVDPRWNAMKAAVVPALGHTVQADQRLYRSVGDEFLMGYLTPDSADQWRDVYTPAQRTKLELMRRYLKGQP